MPGTPISPADQAALRKRRTKGAGTVLNAITKLTGKKPAPVKKAAPPKAKPHPTATKHAPAAAPVDPPLDPETASAVRQKFGAQETELGGQQRVSDQMQGNIGDWFDQYKADVEKSRIAQAGVNAGIQAAQAAQAQQAQGVDQSLATTPEAQQAAAARRSTSDSFGSMLALQSGAQNAYTADQGRIGSGEQVAQHIAEGNRKANLGQQLADLKGQEGDYAVQYKTEADAAAHKAALEDAAFGLDTTKEADSVAAAKTQHAETVRHNKTSEANTKASTESAATGKYGAGGTGMNKYGYTYDEWTGLSKKEQDKARAGTTPGKKGGPTAADKRAEQTRVAGVRKDSNAALTRLDKAKGVWSSLPANVTTGAKDDTGHDALNKDGTPQTRATTDQDRYAELVRQGYSPNEIHLMRLLLENKKWGKQEIAMAHQLGIKVPRANIDPSALPRKGEKGPLDKKGSGSHPASRTGV